MEMKSILINNGFNLEFPEEVHKEAEALDEDFSEEVVAARRDFRDVLTFTIDPEDDKDFDDALSIQWLEDGNCEIGIHIADVTHYVQPGSALDKEAALRSTSVYLVDRVLPMLPEKLSNGLCSLRPNEDKCTFSAVFVFDKNDKIVERWFGKTLIHSNRRYTYEEAQEVLETGEGDLPLN
jgi:ribonuclease R